MARYQVIKERVTEYPNPVKVLKGEVVECLEESDENGEWRGWIYCKTTDNEGWIPRQIIARSKGKGTIEEDYDATEFDLETGETLIEEKTLNGWIWGYKEGKPRKKGWAPLNHIEAIK